MSYAQSFANQYPQTAQNPYGFQPPFQGVAPPVPQGWNVSRDTWNKGFWQFNPAYNHNQARQAAAVPPWQPAQAWANTASNAAQANVNPYKRQPKPPSKEYLATALVENPLGLTNMIPREEVYGKDENAANTPWIWNPRGLVEDEEQDGIITADFRDQTGNRIAREPRGPAPTRRSSSRQQSIERPVQSQSTEPSQIRRGSEPVTQHSHHPSASRHASEPPPGQPPRMSHASVQANQPPGPSRQSSFQYGPPAQSVAAPPQPAPPPPPVPPEDFTSYQPLRTTFTKNIVVTPEYYNSPRRSSSGRDIATPPRRSSLESQMSQMSLTSPQPSPTHQQAPHRQTTQTTSLLRQQSMPESSLTGTNVFVDEPSAMLSPLIMSTPHPSAENQLPMSSRTLGRQYSAPPGVLSAIPEGPSSSKSQPYTAHGHTRHSPQRQQPQVSPSRDQSYERISPPKTSSSVSSSVLSPHRFPPAPVLPPMPTRTNIPPSYDTSPHRSSGVSSASGSASRVSPRQHDSAPVPSPPNRNARRVRKGWWNKRGDHLTSDLKVVYAPPDKAYPPELTDYPEDGYYDEFKVFMGHSPSFAELPESLPRFGKPATRPYESFISYDDSKFTPVWDRHTTG